MPHIILCLPLINLSNTQYSLTDTQIAKPKQKERQPPPPCNQAVSVLCHFSLTVAKFYKEFFEHCNTFINKRKRVPKTHCIVSKFIIRGENNEQQQRFMLGCILQQNFPFFLVKVDYCSLPKNIVIFYVPIPICSKSLTCK